MVIDNADTNSSLQMDRGTPVGNSLSPNTVQGSQRRRLHVFIDQGSMEPVPITGTISVVPDLINTTGIDTIISVGAVTPVPIRVGGSNLAGRTLIIFQSQSGKVRGGFSNSITSSTGGRFFKDQYNTFSIGDSVDFYLISESGTVNVYIAEAK